MLTKMFHKWYSIIFKCPVKWELVGRATTCKIHKCANFIFVFICHNHNVYNVFPRQAYKVLSQNSSGIWVYIHCVHATARGGVVAESMMRPVVRTFVSTKLSVQAVNFSNFLCVKLCLNFSKTVRHLLPSIVVFSLVLTFFHIHSSLSSWFVVILFGAVGEACLHVFCTTIKSCNFMAFVLFTKFNCTFNKVRHFILLLILS